MKKQKIAPSGTLEEQAAARVRLEQAIKSALNESRGKISVGASVGILQFFSTLLVIELVEWKHQQAMEEHSRGVAAMAREDREKKP